MRRGRSKPKKGLSIRRNGNESTNDIDSVFFVLVWVQTAARSKVHSSVARHPIKRIRISWKFHFKNENFVVLAVEASVLKVRNVEERDLVFTVTEEMSPRSIRLSIVVSFGLYPWRTDRECTRSMKFYHVIPHQSVWKDLKVLV